MGRIRHHAIVVTAWSDEDIARAHYMASETFPWVSPISPAITNSCRSFFIPPDGSKEGWPDSIKGDERRAWFIDWIRHRADLPSVSFVEVQFHDDDLVAKVTASDDDDERELLEGKRL